MAKGKAKHDLPGSIYKNGNRWWWKIRLPGKTKTTAIPLKPAGSSMATKNHNVAVECAKMLLAKAVFEDQQKSAGPVRTVAELAKAYLEHVDNYYKDSEGNPTQEPGNIRYSLNPLVELCGSVSLEEFGPLKLIDVRDEMIEQGLARTCINQRIGRIKRMFKWAVSQQVVSAFIYHALSTVEGLKRGRTNAREGKKVRPVDEKHVYMVLDYTTSVVAAMIELQLLTGMRPGELVRMKPKDIERSGEIWHYYPEKHKNAYRGHERIVSIGTRGQELLRPFLLREPDKYCFSPAESEKYRRDKLTENRKTPLSCGNRTGSNRKDNPILQPGDHYDSASYGQAVKRAINAARKAIKAKGGDPEAELPKWTPYQLRHTAATKARKMFNYETAGALLGHSNMSATAIYAERNQGLADEAAKKFG